MWLFQSLEPVCLLHWKNQMIWSISVSLWLLPSILIFSLSFTVWVIFWPLVIPEPFSLSLKSCVSWCQQDPEKNLVFFTPPATEEMLYSPHAGAAQIYEPFLSTWAYNWSLCSAHVSWALLHLSITASQTQTPSCTQPIFAVLQGSRFFNLFCCCFLL